MTPDTHADGELTRQLDRTHVFHSWSAQAGLDPFVIAGGLGSEVWDFDGQTFLDFASQLVNVNIGHGHPTVVAAIQEQAALLATVAPANGNLARGRAAQAIVAHAPAGMNKVFFTNGGADANENAIRLARLHTGRDKILSTYRSYHGNTGSAIVATGDWRRVPNEYARGHVHFFGPYLYRSEFWATSPEQETERALRHLERILQSEGPESVAAILLETVVGTAGVLVPPPGYLPGVRALADRYGIMLILDEVMAGFGRTGAWFAFDHFDVRPDLITFAKGVNSGYVPVGGVVLSDEIAATFDHRVFPGGLTYSGHPLAMASIVAALGAMESEGIVANAARIGTEVLAPGLAALADRHPLIGEVRGLGVFWALELVVDRGTREPVPAAVMGRLKGELMARHLLPFLAENRIHVVPPCVVTDDEVARALAIYDEALTVVEASL
ncbi:aspartate aminotransferase family protein [Pengzhenrongella frigida]|uniref:Aspartate aminotransferase family protein n=1 Tax=Pengzhenrongella frigida TaxID=1259133 RepID=A0A4Q5N0Y7_9MICO|nr:aspartate aminotransferase family protein [Cellulomonas sp. HLT2-17]RYV51748.1 aspartate aminotransferase family protein [Cellulomonas sp. HLT2-17]